MCMRVIVLLGVVFLPVIGIGQVSTLQQLDSLAFASLESNSPDVVTNAERLLSKSSEAKAPLYQINALTILGIVNKNKGYYITALNYYLRAQSIANLINDRARLSACLNNIGSIYHLQANYVEALSYFNESLNIEDELSNPLQKSIRYFNIGDVYNDMDSLSLALNYYTNSLILEKNQQNQQGIIYANLGVVDIYLKSDKLEDANSLLIETRSMLDVNNGEEAILYYSLTAELEKKKGDYKDALIALDKAVKLSKKGRIKTHMTSLLTQQIKIYEVLKDWKRASETYKKLTTLNDQLNSIKIKNQLADLTFQNELNERELELQLVTEERDLANKNILLERNIARYSRKITWFLVLSVVALVTLLFIGFKRILNK